MTKKLLIVASNSREFYTTKRLLEEGENIGFTAQWIHPYQQTLPLAIPSEGIYFHRSTGTNYDDFDLIVSEEHELSGLKVVNPISAIRALRTKDQQWCFFRRYHLPHIPTIVTRGKLANEAATTIEQWSKLDDRFILKMSRGNQGIGVNLVRGIDSLHSFLETFEAMKDQRFLIQPYIQHKREWRLFIHRGDVLVCLEKEMTANDFRGNAKRSKSKNIPIKDIHTSLSELALNAFIQSKLDHAGIDILEDKDGKLLILEINSIPGFEAAEELSGVNIARELLC
jgi:RimK family alpha-L-glutamate ligase